MIVIGFIYNFLPFYFPAHPFLTFFSPFPFLLFHRPSRCLVQGRVRFPPSRIREVKKCLEEKRDAEPRGC